MTETGYGTGIAAPPDVAELQPVASVVGPLESNDNLMMDRSRDHKRESFRFQGYAENKFEHPKIPPIRAGMEKARQRRGDGTASPQYSSRVDEAHLTELDKFRKHQVEAEDFIKNFKNTQMEKSVSIADEKKKDREMLAKYNPWGKPSAGVAHDDTRRKKWFVDSKASRSLVTNETASSPRDSFYLKFGAPGHGAPIRDEYGSVVTDLRGEAEIRFKTSGPINFAQPYRYVGDPGQKEAYRKDLDRIMSDKAVEEQRLRLADLKSDINYLEHNPFAKLGSREAESRRSYRFGEGRLLNAKGEESIKGSAYFPFGRQGAGAPIRDEKGVVVAALSKVINDHDEPQKRLATKIYADELQRTMEERRWSELVEKEYARLPSTDFASMVREGKVGKPKRDPVTGLLLPHPISLSDVSRHLFPAVRTDPQLQTDLDRVAMERAMAREMERHEALRGDEVSIEDGFGRPGAGAPNADGNKKRKLDQVLYRATTDKNAFFKTNEVVEPIPSDMVLPIMQPPAGVSAGTQDGSNAESVRLNYVRNNVNSKHSNLYDYVFPDPKKFTPKSPRDPFVKIAHYKLQAPFATPD